MDILVKEINTGDFNKTLYYGKKQSAKTCAPTKFLVSRTKMGVPASNGIQWLLPL